MSCSLTLTDFLKDSTLHQNEKCNKCLAYVGDHFMSRSKTISIGLIKEKDTTSTVSCNDKNVNKIWNCDTAEFEDIVKVSETKYDSNTNKRSLEVTSFDSSISKSQRLDNKKENENIFDESNTFTSSSSSSSYIALTSSSSSLVVYDNDDDELQCTGYTGPNALSDFPHARENCAVHKFKPGIQKLKCIHCYCYVCDFPASQCTQWDNHCKATHTSLIWKNQRAAAARTKNMPSSASTVAAAPINISSSGSSVSTLSHLTTVPIPGNQSFSGETKLHSNIRWNTFGELLKEIEQVYPVESPDPPGLAQGVVLRPYQRQSLAFMLDIERRIFEKDDAVGCGGWLCDEMGMGKTAVCASLILANPLTNTISSLIPQSKILLKTTMIVTNTTLTQQCISELKKFAPGTFKSCLYIRK